MNPLDDVIVAIATPAGEGALSIVRLSGKDAILVADRRFRGKQKLTSAATHTAHFGNIVDEFEKPVDEAVVTVFREPHSYTTENSVEVSCHGGSFLARRILEVFLRAGARSADPGEFTRRAFSHGRIDLSQAEAVADLIRARSDWAHEASLTQLRGRLSDEIQDLRKEILRICGLVELDLDFADEGIEIATPTGIQSELIGLRSRVQALLASFKLGRLACNGAKVAIVGEPNVGKSSIFNYLLAQNRAIVSPIPGTTRDFVEADISIDGLNLTLIDTAGVRETNDPIELVGIERTYQTLRGSDLVLVVIDASNGLTSKDNGAPSMLSRSAEAGKPIIVVLNKIDLVNVGATMAEELDHDCGRVWLSCKTGSGFDMLRSEIVRRLVGSDKRFGESRVVITNVRHQSCLHRAEEKLTVAIADVDSGKGNELIAIRLKESIIPLAEILGEITTEDVLNTVFGNFCIGK